MVKLVLILLIISMVCLNSSLTSGGGITLPNIGPKATSLGGAFRAISDDYSAPHWNPAGVAFARRSSVSLTGVSTLLSSSLHIEMPPEFLGYMNGKTIKPEKKLGFIPNAGFIFKPVWPQNITAGLAFLVPSGLDVFWDLYDPPLGYGNTERYPKYDWSTKLRIIDLHPVIAGTVLRKRLAWGAGLSFLYGWTTIRQLRLTSSALFDSTTGTTKYAPRPYDHFPLDIVLEGRGWGFGVNAGLLFRPTSWISAGASIKTESKIRLKGKAKFTLYLPTNTEIVRHEPDLANFFSGGVLKSVPSGKANLPLPLEAGFGLALKPLPIITLSSDVSFAKWSSYDIIDVRLRGIDPLGKPVDSLPIVAKWRDTIRYSVGMELSLSSILAFRLGHYLDPSPIPEQTVQPLIPDFNNKSGFTLGISVNFSTLSFDASYEYVKTKERKISRLQDANGDGEFDNIPGRYRLKASSVTMTISYEFGNPASRVRL